jgi:hypothetical protein
MTPEIALTFLAQPDPFTLLPLLTLSGGSTAPFLDLG